MPQTVTFLYFFDQRSGLSNKGHSILRIQCKKENKKTPHVYKGRVFLPQTVKFLYMHFQRGNLRVIDQQVHVHTYRPLAVLK